MVFVISAKFVAAVHFGFVAFVFLGGFLLVPHRWLVWLHAPSMAYALLITVVGWSCPLTKLEQWLLEQAASPVYSGEFLPYYVWSRFGLTGSEPPVITGLIIALVIFNFFPYRAYLRAGTQDAPAA